MIQQQHANPLDQSGKAGADSSTLRVFRNGSLAACAAVGVQQFVPIGLLGPASLPFLHAPLVSLVMQIIGGPNFTADKLGGALLWTLLLYLASVALFAAAFWMRTSPSRYRPAQTDSGLLAVQIILGLLVNPELLYIVAAELALVLPLRPALRWLSLQVSAYIALSLFRFVHVHDFHLICNVVGADVTPLPAQQQIAEIGLDILLSLAFQAMAFCVGYLAAAEKRRRIEIAAAHAELLATRQLLADAAGSSERLKISRDLHDAIGHHLTAINLHLELATRQAGQTLTESLRSSRQLAHRLLAEVRRIVSAERQNQAINLRHALETLCAGISSPRIDLFFDGACDMQAPSRAHVIFNIVSEAIGVAVRRPGTAPVRFAIAATDDGMRIIITGDDNCLRKIVEDSSPPGIRGHVNALGGTLDPCSPVDGLNGIKIWLPYSGGVQ